jgi:hypothetical protein
VFQFSWDNKYAGLELLLSKVLFEGGSAGHADTLKQYQAKVESFLYACLQKNNGHHIKAMKKHMAPRPLTLPHHRHLPSDLCLCRRRRGFSPHCCVLLPPCHCSLAPLPHALVLSCFHVIVHRWS